MLECLRLRFRTLRFRKILVEICSQPLFPEAGRPRHVGFTMPLTKLAQRGEKVDIVFLNVRQVPGSPCAVK